MRPESRRPLILLALALVAGCQPEDKLAPPPTVLPPNLQGYTYQLQIDVEHGTIQVIPPTHQGAGAALDGATLRPAYSLMGNDIVTVTTGNFLRSPVGVGGTNKRKISFDLALTNKLSVSDLVTPTFPVPPGNVTGVLAFPYQVAAFGVTGGKAVASDDWNGTGAAGSGAPTNFFNDFGTCGTAATSDCYRWELFPAPLTPGATTAAQKVGFTVDAGVTTVAISLVVAADLLDHPPPPPPPGTGAITGAVTSSEGGVLPGVTITVAPVGATTVTDGLGLYALNSVPVGAYTVSVGNLPSICTAPTPAPVTLTSGQVARLDITATCVTTTGSVLGHVLLQDVQSLGIPMPTAYPALDVALGGQTTITNVTGTFLLTGVPVGTYPVTGAFLPNAGACTPDRPVNLVVTGGQAQPPAFTVTCRLPMKLFVYDDASAQSLPGVGVTFTAWGVAYSGVTDANGNLLTPPLQTGAYAVTVNSPQGCTVMPVVPATLPVVPYPSRNDFVIPMQCPAPFSATLSGQITGQQLVSAPGLPDEPTWEGIWIIDPNGQLIPGVPVDPQGNFTLPLTIPGTYTLRATDPFDYPLATALGCRTPTPVTVTVPAAGGTITAPPIVQECLKGGVVGTVSSTLTSPATLEVWEFDPAIADPNDPAFLRQKAPIGSTGFGFLYVLPMTPGVTSGLLVAAQGSGAVQFCQPDIPLVTSPAAGQVVRIDFACTSPFP